MREQAERLRLTLQNDGGGAEIAFKEVLKSELAAVFRQYMNVEDIRIDISNEGVSVRVLGGGLKKVGFYSGR